VKYQDTGEGHVDYIRTGGAQSAKTYEMGVHLEGSGGGLLADTDGIVVFALRLCGCTMD